MRILAVYQGGFAGFNSYLSGEKTTLKHFPLPIYLLEEFAKLGEDIYLVCGHDKEIVTEKNGIKIYTYRIPKISLPFLGGIIIFFRQLKLALRVSRGRGFDVVYAMGARASLAGYIVAKKSKAHLVVRLWGTFLYFLIIAGKNYVKAILRHFPEILSFVLPKDGLSITDDGTRGDVVAMYFGIKREKVLFEINGLPKEYFKNSVEPASKRELGLPDDAFVLLMVGRLVGWKGIHRMVKIMPKVIKKVKNAYLVIAGDGPLRKRILDIARKNGIERHIRLLGGVEHRNLVALYDLADIFLSLQRYSNLSNAMLEALMRGKCIITIDDGSLNHFLGEQRHKIAVFLNDSEVERALVDVIYAIAKDKATREFYGSNARKFALENIPTLEDRAKRELEFIYKSAHRVPLF